jgi:hypothetical protein
MASYEASSFPELGEFPLALSSGLRQPASYFAEEHAAETAQNRALIARTS